ncbi:YjaG family protein [Marinospirillum alkaliphilum]|uniref:DUF416 domain-containing protein n=1 Tax=Marinospirillum alkaliphilum DSM 21637 TaxID=1122209 RepID=A0A1K1VDP0_9GAMM|nr:YjaG family protein [Marinospirillum alkaliphilum]SFX23199.1 hypothetical protein SAMN02745752_00915 [Marinospirillum alkaliphilum DSM 21637]
MKDGGQGNKKPPSFNQRLRRLSDWQQLAFATALAQRSAINYQLFSESVAFEGGAELNKLLGLLWESLLVREARINWAVQQEKLPALQPDPAAFDFYGVYPALDAVMALELAVEQRQQPDPDTAVRASKLSRSTVRQFLEMQLPETLEEEQVAAWLNAQPLMQDENDFQDELLAQVSSQFQPHPELIRQIRELARNQGVSNLGISLEDEEA